MVSLMSGSPLIGEIVEGGTRIASPPGLLQIDFSMNYRKTM
jgi:hypothetical protein